MFRHFGMALIQTEPSLYQSTRVVLFESKPPSHTHMSHDLRFPITWYVRHAKPQISLRICAVWSEPLLIAWIYNMTVNPFVPNGISRLYLLNESISILGCWVVFFNIKFIRILLESSVKSIDSDQTPCGFDARFIWVRLLIEYYLEFRSSKGGCTGSSESIHVKMPHCWKSHVAAQ